MKPLSILLIIFLAPFAAARLAHAEDVFSFTDVSGYEKCLRQESMIESSTKGDTQTHRVVDKEEVNARCVGRAEALANQKANDVEFINRLITATTQTINAVHALGLVAVLVKQELKACNEMKSYNILLQGLASSSSDPSAHDADYENAEKVATRCLKDPTFRKDFSEEKSNANPVIRKNACKILLSQKITKSCPN